MSRLGVVIAAVLAVVLHAGFLLFGGLLLPEAQEHGSVTREVELLGKDEPKKDEKPQEPEQKPEIKPEEEPPPNAEAIAQKMQSEASPTPALEAVSLADIMASMGGKGGEFGGEAFTGWSGGVVGGTGRPGGTVRGAGSQDPFSASEVNQEPRPIFQSAPNYPAEMRGKKVSGVVTLLLVVDASGKVGQVRAETCSNPAFEKPAIDAVRQWKFEPGVKGGQRVACKVRVSFKFQPS